MCPERPTKGPNPNTKPKVHTTAGSLIIDSAGPLTKLVFDPSEEARNCQMAWYDTQDDLKSEDELVAELGEVAKKCLDAQPGSVCLTVEEKKSWLETFCAELATERQQLADVCAMISLSSLRGPPAPEETEVKRHFIRAGGKFEKDSVKYRRLLAWSRLTLDLCQTPRGEVLSDEEETSRRKREQVALYCSSVAMFKLGHLKWARDQFIKLRDSVASDIGLCRCLDERYTVESKIAEEKTAEVLKELVKSGRLKMSNEGDGRGDPLFSQTGMTNKEREDLIGKGVGSPARLLYGVRSTNANAVGRTIEDFKPEKEGSPADKSRTTALMIFGEPPDWPGRIPGRGVIMLDSLAGLFGCLTDIVVVSWNVQLMNTTDGKDAEMKDAIKAKAQSAAKVAERPWGQGTGRVGASLVVIQEAPGPQLRHGKKAGANLKEIAKKHLFTGELKKQPFFQNNFDFREVELSNITGKDNEEKGEDHIFGWNRNILDPVDGPDALDAPDDSDEDWQGRAPSWAMFNVLIMERKTTLIAVSVHAKSGGLKDTENDIKMIGKAVDKLWDSKTKTADFETEDYIALLVGDFNFKSSKAFQKNLFADHYSPTEPQDKTTNIWKFNGTGKEDSDGKCFDFACIRSMVAGKKGSIRANLDIPQVVEQELDVVKEEMDKFGRKLKPQFMFCPCKTDPCTCSTDMVDGDHEVHPVTTEIGRKALKSMLDKYNKSDVPSWMRSEFQHFVKMTWSDHMPIAISLAISGASKPLSRALDKEFESAGANGGT